MKVTRRFGRTYRFHLQGRSLALNRTQAEQTASGIYNFSLLGLYDPVVPPRLDFSASWLLHVVFLLDLHFNPKNGRIYSSETSVDFHRTTRRFFPEDNLISYLYTLLL
jgi:hypothetical protein